MDSFGTLFFHTILLRPYVFIFFLIYLLACSLHLGLKRAFCFCIAGYFLTWLSEYSSIHNGIPYGHYYYIEQTRGEEFWVFGVPFMDSISYVFLAYASYSMALMTVSPVLRWKRVLYLLETRDIRGSVAVRVLGALFMVYLDIIIDPVALQGDRWFLGLLYRYPEGGVYFGVPITNFIGWLFVGFSLIYVLQKLDRYLDSRKTRDYFGYNYPWRYLVGPVLYLAVVAFNLSVTFFIHDYTLGWTGIFIFFLPSVLFYFIIKAKLSHDSNHNRDLDSHTRDFPDVIVPVSQ
ncbi:MAG: carotenoid biosynthesis protein [Dissulfurispiraceae bacterium]